MLFELDNVALEAAGRKVLGGLRFQIDAGERVVLLGVNGSGKTTLLKLLDGLMFPSQGTLRYSGQALDPPALAQAAFRRRFRGEVALLFQNVDAMLFCPSVADEIAFGPRQLGLTDIEGRVAQWADTFGVADLLDRPPFELSGGEKKRVALAALLSIDPRVLLLDEATAGLDPAWAGMLVNFLADHPSLTVLASTHNLTLAEELGSRALLLGRNGSGLLFDGPTAELLANQALLIESGLAHQHVHQHHGAPHAHFHVHDTE
jgi:cobalt/nickel transport system ATP-binding protein